MADITNSIYKIRFLDEIAKKRSFVHEIHPLIKLLVTISYIIIVVSFGKYNISGLIPFFVYPFIIVPLADLPLKPVMTRALVAAPFVIGVGIFNPVLDRDTLMVILGVPISGGWISFFSLLIKSALTVLAAILLVATTGMEKISNALKILFVPRIFILQLLLTYRYITVLLEEVGRVLNAYTLRAAGQKGIGFKTWGSLTGQMLLRTIDRAQRIYEAMGLRGFTGEFNTGRTGNLAFKDFLYLVLCILLFVCFRFINASLLIGSIMRGVIR